MSLLSKKTVTEILAKDRERRGSTGKPQLTPGEHILTLTNVELKNSNKTNDPMLVMTLSADDDHASISDNFMLAGNGMQAGLNRIVTFMGSAFKHEMEECEDEQALLTALMKFKGKKFKGAIRIQEELYAWDKDGKAGMTMLPKAKLWYCGTVDDMTFKVNIANAKIPLTPEDKQKYMDFKKEHPDGTVNTQSQGAVPATEKNDDLPF